MASKVILNLLRSVKVISTNNFLALKRDQPQIIFREQKFSQITTRSVSHPHFSLWYIIHASWDLYFTWDKNPKSQHIFLSVYNRRKRVCWNVDHGSMPAAIQAAHKHKHKQPTDKEASACCDLGTWLQSSSLFPTFLRCKHRYHLKDKHRWNVTSIVGKKVIFQSIFPNCSLFCQIQAKTIIFCK